MQCNELHAFRFLLEQNATLRLGLSNTPITADTASTHSTPLLRVRAGSERLPRLRGTAVRGAPKEGVCLGSSSGSRGPDFCHLCLPRGYHHEANRTVVSPRSNVVLASGLRRNSLFSVPLHFDVPACVRPLEYGILSFCLPVTRQQDHDLADHSGVGLVAAFSDHPACDTVLRI